jgi:hypothetical protein
VIAVTQSNNVYALNAVTGAIIWQRNVGNPVTSGLPCGNLNPLGIAGTPAIDLPSRSLFLDAMIDGTTKKHFVFSLNVDTGAINPGWPVDLNATALSNGTNFTSLVQNERGGLAVVNGIVYVPFSGHFGDCGNYHGWVVGVAINNPSSVMAWATPAVGGGIWGHSGVASDGTNMYVVTGNTFSTGGVWGGGEAIIRLQAGPVFANTTANYWAPTNWLNLDNSDADLGGCSALLIDAPGATPSQLVLALGKDRNAYLLDRNNLGGITAPLASMNVSSSTLKGQSSVSYHTSNGTYFAFRAGTSNMLVAYHINPTSPPTMSSAWLTTQAGEGTPFVTSTDGTNNVIVWCAGAGGTQRLNGYDADTGAIVFNGGGANELMTGTRKWNTGIVARGRIYYAADNRVYAFKVPVPALLLSSAVSRKTQGGAGDFDVSLPGVECRSGGANGAYTIVFTFTNDVTGGTASIDSGTGNISGSPVFSGKTATVQLTGVANAQNLTVSMNNVTDQYGQTLPSASATVTLLIGDTNASSSVNSQDVSQTKSEAGHAVTGSNFREDVSADGTISSSDVSLVKTHSGQSVSAPARQARGSASASLKR